jgi:hypothetical protein
MKGRMARRQGRLKVSWRKLLRIGMSNFGASKHWRTAKGMILSGTDAVEFEKWLWREGR